MQLELQRPWAYLYFPGVCLAVFSPLTAAYWESMVQAEADVPVRALAGLSLEAGPVAVLVVSAAAATATLADIGVLEEAAEM